MTNPMDSGRNLGHLVSASATAKLAIGVSLIAFAALISMVANVDSALKSEFSAAFSNDTTRMAQRVSGGFYKSDLARMESFAGSEDFWLGHAGRTNTVPVSLRGPDDMRNTIGTGGIVVGDTITISTKRGKRVLQIEDISYLIEKTSKTLNFDGTRGAPAFVLTAREAGHADGFVMRILVEDGGDAQLLNGRSVPERDL